MSAILGERIEPRPAGFRLRRAIAFGSDDRFGVTESRPGAAFWFFLISGIVLLGVFWGAVVAFAGLNALYLCVALIGCAFVLFDFRIGVVALIVLMPISRSYLFPHEMLGITGLNPLNLLFAGTLGSYLLTAVFGGGIRRFIPRPLFWLYLAPFVLAGAVGSLHVGEIAPGILISGLLQFNDTAGYVRDLVVKPLTLVVFALLVAAAVARSRKPEQFLVPTLFSIWVMSAMVTVFVSLSGVGLGWLASGGSREFLGGTLGMHANNLGALYMTAYALLLFTWAEAKETGLRLVLLASMALVVVSLMLTFSRGGFLGFLVVNLIFVLSRFDAKTLIVACVLAVAALLLLPGAVYDRIAYGFGGGLDAISAGRIDGIWLPLLPDVMRSPLLGHGIGSILWSEATRTGAVRVMQAHNAYLETVLDMGIVGLILLCMYFAHVWRRLRGLGVDPAVSPPLRGLLQGAAAGLVGFLVAGISGGFLTPASEQCFLWLAIGMMYGQLARTPGESSVSSPYSKAGSRARPANDPGSQRAAMRDSV